MPKLQGLQRRQAHETAGVGMEFTIRREEDSSPLPSITIAHQETLEVDDLDTLVMSGLDIDHYLKGNPVVGYNHGGGWGGDAISVPIGRTVSLSLIDGNKLRATWEWVPEGLDAAADRIHKLWDAKFIHAASIWYRPEWRSAEIKPGHEDDFWPPLIFNRSIMKEWCLCYVPKDSLAVRNHLAKNRQRHQRQRARRRLLQRNSNEVLQTVVPLSAIGDQLTSLKQEISSLMLQLKGASNG